MAKQIKIKGVKLVKPEFETPIKEEKESKEVTIEDVVEVKPPKKVKVKRKVEKFGELIYSTLLRIESLKFMYLNATDDVSSLDRQLQDALHELENDELSYHEIARRGMEIQDLRVKRRFAKDRVVLLQEMYDVLQDGQVTHSLNKLKNAASKLRTKENKMDERVYTYREKK